MKKIFFIPFMLGIIFTGYLFSKESNKEIGLNAEKIWELGYKGSNYGYSLPKANDTLNQTLAPNIKKCTELNTVIEQYFCIYGTTKRALNNKKPDYQEITKINIEMLAEFANEKLHYIGHNGYGVHKK